MFSSSSRPIALTASRQRSSKATVPTHRLLTFQLRQHWFGLPIQVTQKVLPPQPLDSGVPYHGSGLIVINQQQIPVLDLETILFGDGAVPLLPSNQSAPEAPAPTMPGTRQRHVLIIQPPSSVESLGLLIDQPPVLRRVPQTAFSAASSVYLILNQLHCVHTVVTPSDSEPAIFMLSLEELLPSILDRIA